MSACLQFRAATSEDAPLISALHVESWRSAYRDILSAQYLAGPVESERHAVWRSRLASPHPERKLMLLAEDHGAAVGFVCVLLDEEPQLLRRLAEVAACLS